MFKITQPLPLWATQLIYSIYTLCFTGAGLAFANDYSDALGSILAATAPLIHIILVATVGEEPKQENVTETFKLKR